MASINKLSVRGIRAFSPEDEEQVITFCFPLTIIVGANGCGKTTIIEALKYAVTGSLPPGNKSGQAFVHDPKSAGLTNVKAQVKLKFTNRAGKSMVVVRSMELIQKKTTMQFKNLDGVLRTTDDQGNKQSLSHKCTELDRQIPQLLGVSKSVLDDVVFCHQEDSSWPLQEGSVLKKKFDAIFDSTRYVKALEEIKNQKKIYNNKVKDLFAQLNLLKGHKHAAGGFRNELDECNHQLSLIKDQMTDLQEKKDAEKKNAQALMEEITKGDELQEAIDDIKNRVDSETVRIETHKAGLRTDLTLTKKRVDLENILKGFSKAMEADEHNLKLVTDRIAEIDSKIAGLAQVQVQKSEEKGVLMGEKKINDYNTQKRLELMEELATKYGLELTFSQTQQTEGMGTQQSRFSSSSGTTIDDDGMSVFTSGTSNSQGSIQITAEDLDAFHRSVEVRSKELQEQLREHREQTSRGEDNIQNELSDLNGKIKALENDLRRLETEREKAKREIQKMSRTISSSRMRKSDIDEAKRQAAKYLKIQNDLNNDPRRAENPREVKEHTDKVESLKADIKEITDVLQDLRKCAEEQNAIDMLEHQVTQDMELVEEMKNENSFLLQQYNTEIPLTGSSDRELMSTMETLAGEVGDKYDTSTRSVESSSEVLKESESRFSELSALLNQNKNTLGRRKEQLAALVSQGRGVQRIKNVIKDVRQYEQQNWGESLVSATTEPQQLLEHFTTKLGELATENDQPESVSRTITKLRKMAKRKDASGNLIGIICPCCTRSLDAEEAQTFKENMETLADVTNSPIVQMDLDRAGMSATATRSYETWRNTVSASINDWLDYKRISTEVESLKEKIAPGEDELKIVESQVKEAKKKLNDDREEEANVKQLQDLLVRLRDDVNKIASKKNQISSKKEELSLIAPRASGKDLRTTERELSAKTDEKETRMNAISALNGELSELMENINRAANQATKANKITRDKEEQFAKEQQDAARKKELNDKAMKNKEQEDRIQDEIMQIRPKARIKETEKNKFRSESKREEHKRQDLLNQFKNESEKIDPLTRQINQFSSGDKVGRLKTLVIEVNSITEEIADHEEDQKSCAPELEQLKSRVSDQKSHRKDVERNIELLNMVDHLQKLEDDQDLLQDKWDKMNTEDTRNEYNLAKRNMEKYTRDCDRSMGSKDSLMVQFRDLKRKLNTTEYKDIDEKHRVKMIEHETCKMAVTDLDLYYSALDKALLKYHGLKIKDINKIIKEMWALTYRGEDITNIRLTSDQESSSKASRSYNYRVVMTKGTTELDMRGRCSAGQRVLASIVIRLALAETFCINCGVMALDEPTTNLDHKNKYGLAVALAQIIAQRAAQDNFQLVIITHDEEFVSMMKQELASQTGFDMPDKYFQVSREQSSDGVYYSKIRSIDWDEI